MRIVLNNQAQAGLGAANGDSFYTGLPVQQPNRLSELPAQLYALNFSNWKRPVVRQCFPGRRVKFVAQLDSLPRDAHLIVWGMTPVPANRSDGGRVLRLEDGFLRSVGLGADLIRPLSWVVDSRGIYFDATRPSDLEVLLSTRSFDPALLARAARLRTRVVREGLTKYNVGETPWQRPRGTRRVVLVPGQVESDASLAYGAPEVRRNLDLLKAVKTANPDAYLVYKPHPDVVARLRAAGAGEADAARWCDEVVTDADMGQLLREVDEVHLLTSLTGFEALLRGKPVTCYGRPFYAGWGLTRDIVPIDRRTRSLTLDELVAGALICYPSYFDRGGRDLLAPEQALDELVARRARPTFPWGRSLFRVARRVVDGAQ
jgi:capsular polysaccharide export protein